MRSVWVNINMILPEAQVADTSHIEDTAEVDSLSVSISDSVKSFLSRVQMPAQLCNASH